MRNDTISHTLTTPRCVAAASPRTRIYRPFIGSLCCDTCSSPLAVSKIPYAKRDLKQSCHTPTPEIVRFIFEMFAEGRTVEEIITHVSL